MGLPAAIAYESVAATDRQVRDAVETAWSNFQSTLGTIESNEATQKADEIAFEGVRLLKRGMARDHQSVPVGTNSE